MRRYPRLTVRVELTLEIAGREIETLATTLGAGGLFVAGDFELEPGTPLIARFQLPGEPAVLRMAGRVAWRARDGGDPGLGLEFVDPDARAMLASELESWASARDDAVPEPF